MSFPIINDITTGLLFPVFGHGLIMALVMISIIIIILLIFRVNIATIFIVLLPLVLGLVYNPKLTNMIELPPWIFYALLLGFGFILFTVIIVKSLRN